MTVHCLGCSGAVECPGITQEAPAPEGLPDLHTLIDVVGSYHGARDSDAESVAAAVREGRFLGEQYRRKRRAEPRPPEGLAYRSHVACCWCDEHHEEGK